MWDDPERLYRSDGVAHIVGVINDKETFGECPEGADEKIVRRYTRAYIMMLLGTQLFADKFGNHVYIRWLPYVARFEEMGGYSWGSAALEMYLGDPRAVPIPVKATQRGAGRVPEMDRVDNVPDRRDVGGHVGGGGRGIPAGIGGVSPRHGGHGREWYGSGMGDGSTQGDSGLGSGPLGDYFVGVPGDDHALHESLT
ncbi:hypothetical protein Ahy_A07g032481 [Arachis hypogaea]|uniref:Aminotransferase-like plant mobile domain-containing protein n=1 Tax=Arachis hypogaea TaxID=3818 RepID=A0A445C709_ARAHY|nr:hypothetical protein Ahy_A07g032481 [Arachis hypogaea]